LIIKEAIFSSSSTTKILTNLIRQCKVFSVNSYQGFILKGFH
jgi:hypothetical protein